MTTKNAEVAITWPHSTTRPTWSAHYYHGVMVASLDSQSLTSYIRQMFSIVVTTLVVQQFWHANFYQINSHRLLVTPHAFCWKFFDANCLETHCETVKLFLGFATTKRIHFGLLRHYAWILIACLSWVHLLGTGAQKCSFADYDVQYASKVSLYWLRSTVLLMWMGMAARESPHLAVSWRWPDEIHFCHVRNSHWRTLEKWLLACPYLCRSTGCTRYLVPRHGTMYRSCTFYGCTVQAMYCHRYQATSYVKIFVRMWAIDEHRFPWDEVSVREHNFQSPDIHWLFEIMVRLATDPPAFVLARSLM